MRRRISPKVFSEAKDFSRGSRKNIIAIRIPASLIHIQVFAFILTFPPRIQSKLLTIKIRECDDESMRFLPSGLIDFRAQNHVDIL